MKKDIRIKASELAAMISEAVKECCKGNKCMLNEGPGAGYTVRMKDLTADNVQITDQTDGKVTFTADLKPCVAEWTAEGYYGGPSSEGIYYDGDIVQEFDDEDNRVDGGTVTGTLELDPEYMDEAQDIIASILSDFEFESMVGGGYSHTNLDNPMVFDGIEITNGEDYLTDVTVTVNAPNIVSNVNWWFEHWSEFDEIFNQDDEEYEDTDEYDDEYEDDDEDDLLSEAVRRAIRKALLREGQEWVGRFNRDSFDRLVQKVNELGGNASFQLNGTDFTITRNQRGYTLTSGIQDFTYDAFDINSALNAAWRYSNGVR